MAVLSGCLVVFLGVLRAGLVMHQLGALLLFVLCGKLSAPSSRLRRWSFFGVRRNVASPASKCLFQIRKKKTSWPFGEKMSPLGCPRVDLETLFFFHKVAIWTGKGSLVTPRPRRRSLNGYSCKKNKLLVSFCFVCILISCLLSKR